jgi:hypothetical protein
MRPTESVAVQMRVRRNAYNSIAIWAEVGNAVNRAVGFLHLMEAPITFVMDCEHFGQFPVIRSSRIKSQTALRAYML